MLAAIFSQGKVRRQTTVAYLILAVISVVRTSCGSSRGSTSMSVTTPYIFPDTYVPGFHYPDEVKKLEYRPLGDTGLKVCRVGFGGACLGQCYGKCTFEQGQFAVVEALKRGVNYIDTAPYYGDSESVLGRILRDVPRKAYYLATKVGRYPGNVFDYSRERTRESVRESLKKLGVDRLDVVQVHDVEFPSSTDPIIYETLPALEEMVTEGLIRFIGVTGYCLRRLVEVIERSRTPIKMVLTYSRRTLMDDSLRDYVGKLTGNGRVLLHASPTALGLLTNKGSMPWHPGNYLYYDLCQKAAEFCKENGVELGDLAVGHTLMESRINVNLIGMPTVDIVKANLKMQAKGISDRDKMLIEEIFKRFFKPSDRLNWENIEVNEYRKSQLLWKSLTGGKPCKN